MSDYYNLLKVTPDASPEDIRKGFRILAKRVHPDAHPNLPPREKEAQRRRFILLAQAYETLRDPQRRHAYDRQIRKDAAQKDATARAGQAGASRASGRGASPASKGRGGESMRRPERAKPAGDGGARGAGENREPLDDLLHEVEDLLSQFGLNLKQPFQELVDALLDWARDIFRKATEIWAEEGETEGEDENQARPASGERKSTDRRSDPEKKTAPGKNRPGEGDATFREAKTARPGQPPSGTRVSPLSAEQLEAELGALKSRVRKGEVAAGREPSLEEELRRLKTRLGRN